MNDEPVYEIVPGYKRFFHRFGHFWKNYPSARKPDRRDWHCHLRQCTVCRKVEYESFALFGDKKWHDLSDDTGCMPWEWQDLRKAAIFTGLTSPEEIQAKWDADKARRRKDFDKVMAVNPEFAATGTPEQMDSLFESFEQLFDVLDIKNYSVTQKKRLREDMLALMKK